MAKKKDLNQPEIERGLKDVGAVILSIHEVKNAFDLLVGFRGQLYGFEIKNPEYKPKRGPVANMLTDGEAECILKFATVGVIIHIIFSLDDALEIIGAI